MSLSVRSTRPRRLLLAAAAVGLAASATASVAGPALADSDAAAGQGHAGNNASYHPPKIKHVWTIVLENKSYEASFSGLNRNSYLWKTLPSDGLLMRQYYGTSHFSQGNYLSMVSGQATSPGPQIDCPLYNETGPVQKVADQQAKIVNDKKKSDGTYNDGSVQPGCVFPSSVQTMFNQFDKAGVSYKGYMQDMGNDPQRETATCGNPLNSQPGPAVVNPGGSEGPYGPAPASFASPNPATPDDAYVAKHNPFRGSTRCWTTATAHSTSSRWPRTCCATCGRPRPRRRSPSSRRTTAVTRMTRPARATTCRAAATR